MHTAIAEIDVSTGAVFRAQLIDAIDGSDEAFVGIDCSGVTFMGSAGYLALVDATEYAARRGHTLVIRNMSSSCARLLELCTLGDELTIERPRAPRPHPLETWVP